MFDFRKIWRALFSSITRFDVHPFGLLAATLLQIRQLFCYRMRQKFITKCGRFFIIKCDSFINIYDDNYNMRRFYYKMRRHIH